MTIDDIFSDLIPNEFEMNYPFVKTRRNSGWDGDGEKFYISEYYMDLPYREIFMMDKSLEEFIPGFISSVKKYFEKQNIKTKILKETTTEHRRSMQYREYVLEMEETISLRLTLDLSKKFLSFRIKSYDEKTLHEYDCVIQKFGEELNNYINKKIKLN